MEVDKPTAKGGFFQLFDWNVKSRKKLFSSKSELAENSNNGKLKFQSSSSSRLQQDLENGICPNARSQINFDYASSSYESEYGTRPPGVVARLMGLDSLPTSSVSEHLLNSCIDSHSLGGANYSRASPAFQSEHDIVIFESVRNKLDGSTKNPLDLRLQKVNNKPVERFQTEVLPPKSAKPVSITHHRFLSPIKSPGFIPPKNAAYIIEAAAKLIEQSPRSAIKVNLPLLESSSVRLKVQDFRENTDSTRRSFLSADVSQKGKEHNFSKHTKKRLSSTFKGYDESKDVGSQRSKAKEKPVSITEQEKANIRKKDRLSVACNGNIEKRKELNDAKPGRVIRSRQKMQNKVERKSSSRQPAEVLTVNHQKQNCASSRDGDNVEPSASCQKDGKDLNSSTNYNHQKPRRTVNKVVVDSTVQSRKTKAMATELGKEVSSSVTSISSNYKVLIDENSVSDLSTASKVSVMKDEKSIRRNVAIEGNSKLNASDNKSSLDVVSFTFTSPIKKSESGSNSRGFGFAGGDALSVLLEQKLKELSSKVELSQQNLSGETSFSSFSNGGRNMDSPCNSPQDVETCKGKREFLKDSNFPARKLWLEAETQDQVVRDLEDCKNDSNSEHHTYLSLQGVIPLSTQPSFSGDTCDSSDTAGISSSGMQCLSVEFHPSDLDTETSDTASSLSVGALSESVASTLHATDSKHASCWELQYIVEILNNAELMSEDFALRQDHEVLAPALFDQLENQKPEMDKIREDPFLLQRRILFDCVNECLEFRCRRLVLGSGKIWAKQIAMLNRKQLLAEEVYREISSWTNLEELMVDELVDKDMSSHEGKWVDFETEAFDEGVEIENRILISLIDELVDDF